MGHCGDALEKKSVGCWWIYEIKYNKGEVDRARLIVKEYSQTLRIDFQVTFASIVKTISCTVLMSIAAQKGWKLCQIDATNAFLHWPLEEEIYMDLLISMKIQGYKIQSTNSRSHYMDFISYLKLGIRNLAIDW